MARHLHGVRPGINLLLHIDGDIVGVIGLTGDPLEYRLNRISELTGLNLGHFDDRPLLYVAWQLDEQG